jgi:hypothetical protein
VAHKKIRVPTVSLADLLREHKAPRVIDFMSVDVEGAELEILSAFDFDAYDIRLMCIEHNFTDAQPKIRAFMEGLGYAPRFEGISRWDWWFAKQ